MAANDMKLLLLSAFLALFQLEVGAQDYCFGKDLERTQTRHFTSKTAYQIVRGTNMEKQYQVNGCVAQKVWIFHRHGTRLPSKSTIEKAPHLEVLRDSIVKNYKVLKTAPETDALCQEDLIAIKIWKWNASITSDIENYLTSQGYEDLRGTAKTYQRYFPGVLKREYSSTNYLFRHTDSQRTIESFKAFSEGLFGSGNSAKAEDTPNKDYLLRPEDYCESWKAQNYKDEGSEYYKYRNSEIYNKTIEDISKRLGFQYTLDASDVELMYDICRYEQAWHVERVSVWCAVFLPEQVNVFEYGHDLKYFYKFGYGFKENTQLNCRVVQDMLHHLSSTETPNVVVHFGHSAGLQTLVSALGVNKDSIDLLANNYHEMSQRKWKISNIDPFAANFLAVKYYCDAEPIDKEKVVFFLNQNAVDLDWCAVGLCNWSDVKKRYSTILNADCDSYYCTDGATVVSISVASLFMAAIIYLNNLL